MATPTTMTPSEQIVCNRCWGPVSVQHNFGTNKYEVTPCRHCLQEMETKAVKAAAEDIQAVKRGSDHADKKAFREGFREGWKEAMDYCDSHHD